MHVTDDQLIALATDAMEKAYAPYSNFKVGAALLLESGEVECGCNVENVSYGLTMCAERVAVGAAVQKGISKFLKLAIVANSKEAIVPCGACRQVLAEFNPALQILSARTAGRKAEFNLADLLPIPRQGILG